MVVVVVAVAVVVVVVAGVEVGEEISTNKGKNEN